MGYDVNNSKTFPKGTWDFSVCEIKGLSVGSGTGTGGTTTAVFG
jgi:hypothetical protein